MDPIILYLGLLENWRVSIRTSAWDNTWAASSASASAPLTLQS